MTDHPKFLRDLAHQMTLGDPVIASKLILAAKEIERLTAPPLPPTLYQPCAKHMGMPWKITVTATATTIARTACPICEELEKYSQNT